MSSNIRLAEAFRKVRVTEMDLHRCSQYANSLESHHVNAGVLLSTTTMYLASCQRRWSRPSARATAPCALASVRARCASSSRLRPAVLALRCASANC